METCNSIVTQSNYLEIDSIDAFSSICCEVLNKYAPPKQRFLRVNRKTIDQCRNFLSNNDSKQTEKSM